MAKYTNILQLIHQGDIDIATDYCDSNQQLLSLIRIELLCFICPYTIRSWSSVLATGLWTNSRSESPTLWDYSWSGHIEDKSSLSGSQFDDVSESGQWRRSINELYRINPSR